MMYYLTIFLATSLVLGIEGQTALDDYVRRPDAVFGYTYLYTLSDLEKNVDVHVINMTSQQWKDETVSSQSIWWHYLSIIVPRDEVKYTETATMLISLGDNTDEPPTLENDYFVGLAADWVNETGAICAVLNNVPNQPIRFTSDPTGANRKEDSIIGYSWKLFMQQLEDNMDDPEVLALFPMTKAAIRAMDVVQNYTSTSLGMNVGKFVVAGPSKRGWATWLAAAVDPQQRVTAIAPMVFSVMNMNENLQKHWRSLGGWSWAFKPYWNNNITHMLGTPEFSEIARHTDPYSYRDRLTMPKMVIGSSGDEFFLLDDSRLWWDDIPGTNMFLMFENSNHPMIGHHDRLINNLATMYIIHVDEHPYPDVSWQIHQTAQSCRITMRSDAQPLEILSYHANTTDGVRRDFRLLVQGDGGTEVNPVIWEEGPVRNLGGMQYEAEYTSPEEGRGWLGFFILMRYPGPNGRYIELTSEVCITPDTFPFPRCTGYECFGTIV